MDKMLVSIDGLAVHDLAAMDMDAFREWLWPGIEAEPYIIDVLDGEIVAAYRSGWRYRNPRNKSDRILVVLPKRKYKVMVYSYSLVFAKRKAMAMVKKHISARPCAMEKVA